MLFTNMFVRTIRVKNMNKPGVLARLLSVIGDNNGYIGDIKTVHYGHQFVIRDIEVMCISETEFSEILKGIKTLPDITILDTRDEVLALHSEGKLEMKSKIQVETIADLRKVYTPGVASVAKIIKENPLLVDEYTWRGKTVAIVTNGSRVLGLGNIGVLASLPVMEGKAALLNQLVGLYGIPILVNTRDIEEFINIVIKISESFGAIHLEDIETPACFEIENRLRDAISKPVMHDDQHGTAVVTLAAAMNVCSYNRTNINRIEFGQIGLGAAGFAIARLIMAYTGRPVSGFDVKEDACKRFKDAGGRCMDSIEDIFKSCKFIIASTAIPDLIKTQWIRNGQFIFSLSNPVPEIDPEQAIRSGAAFAADGRVINNILAYPGIFKGSLKVRAKRIVDNMLISAAETLARCAGEDELLPNPLNKDVHKEVAKTVARVAVEAGVATREIDEKIKDY